MHAMHAASPYAAPANAGEERFAALYAEIERLPPGVTGEILSPGVLSTMSRPGRAHGRAAKQCLRALDRFDRDSGGKGWWVAAEHEIRLPEGRLVVPDLAGWREERVAFLPEENPIAIVPDWCCEVLSASTVRVDRLIKLPLYARCGITWTWLVEPSLQSIEVYQTISGLPALVATAQGNRSGPLPPFDVELNLATWWMADQPHP